MAISPGTVVGQTFTSQGITYRWDGEKWTGDASSALISSFLEAVYPIGSIYINASNSSNPNTLFGFGTWVEFGSGRVLVSQNTGDTSFNVLEETGGNKDAIVVDHSHSATTSITDPGHRHQARGGVGGAVQILGAEAGTFAGIGPGSLGSFVDLYSGSNVISNNTTGISASTTITSQGSSGTNANLQPYIVVKMWKRTA